jgi:hypothetical protein
LPRPSSLTNIVVSMFSSLLMLKFCCQILIAINKEKKNKHREFNVYLKILFSDSHCYQQRKKYIKQRKFNVYVKILFSDSHCYQQQKN